MMDKNTVYTFEYDGQTVYALDEEAEEEYIHEAQTKYPYITDEEIAQLSENELANLCADVSNASGMLMHLVSEEGTNESDLQVCCDLYEKLKDRIIAILKEDLYSSSSKNELDTMGFHNAVKPFTKRYGYIDGSGWWIKNTSNT